MQQPLHRTEIGVNIHLKKQMRNKDVWGEMPGTFSILACAIFVGSG